ISRPTEPDGLPGACGTGAVSRSFSGPEDPVMEHIAAILLIVGCSSDLTQCRELPAPTPLFETTEECAQTQPFALDDLAGRRPRVFGTCVAVDPALEEADAEIV